MAAIHKRRAVFSSLFSSNIERFIALAHNTKADDIKVPY